jgi:hypothetical protein
VSEATYYGRSAGDWTALEETGLAFLRDVAHRNRVTSYTEFNTVLAQRTGVRPFDFDREDERAAMGQLLLRITDREFDTTGLLLSAIVLHLNENDAGPGFYGMAKDKGLLPRSATRDESFEFWANQVTLLHAQYSY